jgi:hypothetical protein
MVGLIAAFVSYHTPKDMSGGRDVDLGADHVLAICIGCHAEKSACLMSMLSAILNDLEDEFPP